jgi:RNA polymerase sigma factor (TIGR02999 family)
MPFPAQHEFTQILQQVNQGDQNAFAKLIALVYDELHDMASRRLRRERNGHTLNTTGLVHEAYLKLVNQSAVGWNDRMHFFRAASQAMRRVLVDQARRHGASKRGAGIPGIAADAVTLEAEDFFANVIEINDALNRLTALNTRQAEIVELHLFGGCSIQETAEILHISPATMKREWASARVWLYRELFQDGDHVA